jgi:hypothetical protein
MTLAVRVGNLATARQPSKIVTLWRTIPRPSVDSAWKSSVGSRGGYRFS